MADAIVSEQMMNLMCEVARSPWHECVHGGRHWQMMNLACWWLALRSTNACTADATGMQMMNLHTRARLSMIAAAACQMWHFA